MTISSTPSDRSAWPLPSLHFQVQWDTAVMSFEAMSGLEALEDLAQAAAGPGLGNCGQVTMRHGLFRASHTFWDWFSQIRINASRRTPAIVTLLDDAGRPVTVWTLSNAWPTGITGTNLTTEGTEVAITSIEIAHEGLSVTRN